MHECPECGLVCTCSGDIDDCPVFTEKAVLSFCVCDHEGSGLNDRDDWDTEPPDQQERP